MMPFQSGMICLWNDYKSGIQCGVWKEVFVSTKLLLKHVSRGAGDAIKTGERKNYKIYSICII